jgi:hypothetical protein
MTGNLVMKCIGTDSEGVKTFVVDEDATVLEKSKRIYFEEIREKLKKSAVYGTKINLNLKTYMGKAI